jgi:hypothetical protein
MLRAVSTPARPLARARSRRLRPHAALVMAQAIAVGSALGLGAACGDDDDDAPATTTLASGSTASPWSDGLAKGELEALLGALQQGHLRARASLGPHHMKLHSELALVPEGAPATHEPAVGELRPVDQHVVDDLELVWASGDDNRPHFSLAQSNDHERGREVVVDGLRMYTRHRHRGWYVQDLQADLHELWLDDAQRSIYDAVALAAPRLVVQAAEEAGAGLAGGVAIRFTLQTAAADDPARVLTGHGQGWRSKAEIDEVSGNVLVDRASGCWLAGEVHVRYALAGPDGRRLRGSVDVTGSVAPLSPELAHIEIPGDAQPLLERTRYEAERARLLDGLAGP